MNHLSHHVFSLKGSIKRSKLPRTLSPCSRNVRNPSSLISRSFYFSARRTESTKSKNLYFRPLVRNYATVKPFKLADIGEGIAEVEVLQWFIKVGDQVNEFDPICEVQSDKATVEIKSPFEGVIKRIYYEISDMAKVGSALCDIEVKSSQKDSNEVVEIESQPATQKKEKSEEVLNDIVFKGKVLKVLATPAVRFLAKQNNINLTDLTGTGKDGRVTKGDIIEFLEGKTKPKSFEVSKPETVSKYVPGESKVVKLKGYARAMAKKMEESLLIPHFGYCEEIAMDELMKLRLQLKPIFESKGVKLSNLPFIIKICSLALKEYPILNSSINKELTEITYHGSHNIGIAVDTPTGLVVPNIKNVQDLSIFEIAQELQRILELAQANKIPPQDLAGGTFSLSNIGKIGGTYAKPVVVLPEVCIGALGKIQTLPRFDEKGNVVPVNIMQFSWSADHRAVDGASMASFSNKIKQYIENPGFIVMDTK